VELADSDAKPLDGQHGRPDLVCGLASQLHRCLFAFPHLLLARPERQYQHLGTLAVAQGEVASEAGDRPNHGQHPLTHEPQVELETAVVSDTGKARESPEHTTPFGSLGPTPASCAMIVTMAYDEDLANRIRELIVIHCSKEETEALLAKPGARPFEMRGEMKGWLRVDAESVSTKRALEPWAMQSVPFARALPPKEKK